jgi:putative DNA primase/helicase
MSGFGLGHAATVGQATNGHVDPDQTGFDAERWATNVASLTVDDLETLLSPTDHAMALMFERFFRGRVYSSPEYGVRTWGGLVWDQDSINGRHRDWAVETIETLMAAAGRVPIPAVLIAERKDVSPLLDTETIEANLRKSMRGTVRKWLGRNKLNAMIEMATLRKPFLKPIAAFDREPLLFAAANGVVDLRTGEPTAARPELMLTKATSVAYDRAAGCPRFERFLAELFPVDTEPIVRFVQRLVGWWLTGSVRDHVLPIFWGEGSNGKSTLLKVVTALLGPYAQVAALTLLLESRHGKTSIPNDVARLVGTRLVVTSETPERGRLAEATVKTLTGGDRLTGRFLHKEFFDFDPTHKVLLVTNHKPQIYGQDWAMWRRIALVPFTVKFWRAQDDPPAKAPLQDPDLADALMKELPGILNWAIQGCLDWQRDGLDIPVTVQAATKEYRREEDTLGPFLDDCCVIDRTAWVSAKELYDRYTEWAGKAHEKPMSTTAFGRALTSRGFKGFKQGGTRGWTGLTVGQRLL